MPDLLEISKSIAPFWKPIVLFLVYMGVVWAYWKADRDTMKRIHHSKTSF